MTSSLEQSAANDLKNIAERLAAVPTPKPDTQRIPIPTSEASLARFHIAVERYPKGMLALYKISFPDNSVEEVYRAFKLARDEKRGGRAFSRSPREPLKSTEPNAYVGSSQSLGKRIREHFGLGAKSTYSLHMDCWATYLCMPEIEVRLYAPETDKRLILILEDHWANLATPLFGRRGSV